MTWESAVVAYLAKCKAAGRPFESSWRGAMRMYPPKGNGAPSMLFDDEGRPVETLVAFFHRVAENAYLDLVGGPGNGPDLRGFRAGMLVDDGEPVSRRRKAA